MTDQELNEIEARANAVPDSIRDDLRDIAKCWNLFSDKGKYALLFLVDAHKDVLALIAEVRQLKKTNANLVVEFTSAPVTRDERFQQMKAERDAIIQALVSRDECPGNFIDCLNEDHRGSKKDCWLEWARKEAGKVGKE